MDKLSKLNRHNIRIGLSPARLYGVGFMAPWEIKKDTRKHSEVIDWWMKCNLGQWLLLNDIKVSINPYDNGGGWNNVTPLYVDFVLSDEENILYCLAGFNDA